MLRFDLNISILLREVPFLERFERVRYLPHAAYGGKFDCDTARTHWTD